MIMAYLIGAYIGTILKSEEKCKPKRSFQFASSELQSLIHEEGFIFYIYFLYPKGTVVWKVSGHRHGILKKIYRLITQGKYTHQWAFFLS